MNPGWNDQDFSVAYLEWARENPNDRVKKLVDEVHASSADSNAIPSSVTLYDALVVDVWRRLHEVPSPAQDWYRRLVTALGFPWQKQIPVGRDSRFKDALVAVLSLLEEISSRNQTLTGTYRTWVGSPEKRFRLPRSPFTNTLGWTKEQIQTRLDEVLNEIEVSSLSDAAGKWWNGWNEKGVTDPMVILRRAEELAIRGATIEHAHRCYVGDGGQDWRRTLLALDAAREEAEWIRRKDHEPNDYESEWDSLLSLPWRDGQLDFETMTSNEIQRHYESLMSLIGWPNYEECGPAEFQKPEVAAAEFDRKKTRARAEWNALHERAGGIAVGTQRMVRLAECLELHSVRWDTFVQSRSSEADTSILGSVYRASLKSQQRDGRVRVDLRYGEDEIGDYADVVIIPRNGDDEVMQRMRWLPPNTFMMGSPDGEDGRFGDETLHRVVITEGFWMADTPCTQEFWKTLMQNNPSRWPDAERPVEQVSWDDVQRFIAQLNQELSSQSPLRFRLPTEAEWEYACRAGSSTAYCFGDDSEQLSKYACFDENSNSSTQVVKQLLPNKWGLYDMHGNVWEWCYDWLGNYEPTEEANPVGPERGLARVIRGGSWNGPARCLRSAVRGAIRPSLQDGFLGFRLLSSAFEPSPYESLPPGISNTKDWTDDQVSEKLHEVKKGLDWDNAGPRALLWWREFENLFEYRKPIVLRLAEELAVRMATIDEFHLAYLDSETNNIQANLFFLDYTRLRVAEERKTLMEAVARRIQHLQSETEAELPAPMTPNRWADWTKESLALGFTNKLGWSEEQVRARLEDFKKRLDWASTTDSAKRWWNNIENEDKSKLNLVLRLAEELAVRKASITEFYDACLASRTHNIQANLHYLDYTRLKKEEKEKEMEKKREKMLADTRPLQDPSSQTDTASPALVASNSESTELTFVRCSSCKNLVPEAAEKCRICNAPLPANKAASEPNDG